MQHVAVNSTCTMSHIIGWDIPQIGSKDPKVNVNAKLNVVNELMKLGFKRDFAGLMATTTHKQVEACELEVFMPKIGFQKVFHGSKADAKEQRHQETGDVYLWAAKPLEYEEALKAYHTELTDLKDKIDPPKKPDPKRQVFEDILLSKLRKAGIVQDNSGIDNRLEYILLVSPEAAAKHIKLKFGIDIKKWNGYGDNWTKSSTRRLKEDALNWKKELV